jgi:hypothetical protein
MKTHNHLFFSIIFFVVGFVASAQSTKTLEFSAQGADGIDKVVVRNLSRVCKDTVLYNGTSLVLPGSISTAMETSSAGNGKLSIGSLSNPFLDECQLFIYVASSTNLSLELFSMDGRKLSTMARKVDAGEHRFVVRPGKYGTFIVTVCAGGETLSAKLMNAGYSSQSSSIRYIAENGICRTAALGADACATAWRIPTMDGVDRMTHSGRRFLYLDGDSLSYTVYVTGYAKETIVDRPFTSKHYVIIPEVPVVSFAVISDVHFGNSKGEGPLVKVPRALRNLMLKKPLVDAIFVAGDLTESGTNNQYDQFLSVFNNTSIIPSSVEKVYMMGNHDNYSTDAHAIYQTKTGQPLDQYKVINGIPFISISQRDRSNAGNGLAAYPVASREFLQNSLEAAARDYPGKPIFVFTHVAPLGTCYGSRIGDYGAANGWGMPVLTPILKEFPQAVVFSGHSHFPIGDPRSISQDSAFTSINAGSTTYSEVEQGLLNIGIHPEQSANVTEGYVVHVLANGDVQIDRWDTYRDEEIFPEWRLKAPHDGSQFVYKNNRTGRSNPFFEDDATVSVVPGSYSCSVTFPQAFDDEVVQRYTVEVYMDEVRVTTYRVFSQFYLNGVMPHELTVSELTGLVPDTDYRVRVVANDSYGNLSAPIETTFRTTPDNDPANQVPSRNGQWLFNDDEDLLRAEIGSALLPAFCVGSRQITYPVTGNANIVRGVGPSESVKAVVIPKGSCVKMEHALAPNGGGTNVNEYSLLIDFKVDLSDAWYPIIQTNLANTDDGDIFIRQNGSVGLNATGAGYSLTGLVKANGWHRLVMVVKAGERLRIYLDGGLILTGNADMTVNSRWSLSPQGVLLFADESNEDGNFTVAEVSIWDTALSPAQVANLGLIK